MPIPDYQTLMHPVLRLAADADGEISISQCLDGVADLLGISEEDRKELLPTGRQAVFYNRIQWAKTYLRHAGVIEAPRRGHLRITARLEVVAAHPDRVDNTVLSQFPEFVEWRQRSAQGQRRAAGEEAQEQAQAAPDETPVERMENAYQEVLGELKGEMLNRILLCSPTFFETLIVDLLVSMGYGGSRAEAGKAVGRTGDEGIDGIIKEDTLGLEIVYIQAKRYQPGNTVGRPAVQAFAGSLEGAGATKGIFVTTSNFSRDAHNYVERIAKRIILIDGEELSRLLIEHGVGVRQIQVFELNRVDEDYFTEE